MLLGYIVMFWWLPFLLYFIFMPVKCVCDNRFDRIKMEGKTICLNCDEIWEADYEIAQRRDRQREFN